MATTLRLRGSVIEESHPPMVRLPPPAIGHALNLDHPVYDCFYLALAEAEKTELVTADLRRAGCVPSTPWGASIRSL